MPPGGRTSDDDNDDTGRQDVGATRVVVECTYTHDVTVCFWSWNAAVYTCKQCVAVCTCLCGRPKAGLNG